MTMTHEAERTPLARSALGGVVWEGSAYIAGRMLVLATTVALARLLAPRDFGVVALALLFVSAADTLANVGFSQALIYLSERARRNDAALVLSLAIGGCLAVVVALSAPLVGRFFAEMRVVPLVRACALVLLLSALWQVPDALLRKQLRFRRRMTADIGRAAARGAASIVLAVAGAGPWSIVGGMLAGDAVYTVAVWTMTEYRPRWGFWRIGANDLRPLLSYGAPAAGAAILSYFLWNVDYLIIGRLLGTEQLGYYLVAFRLPEMAIVYVFWIFSRVAFPTYTRVRTEPDRLARGYLRALRLQSIYAIGVATAIAVAAPLIVPVVFGARWSPAVVPLSLLALYAAFRALGQAANDVFVATGHPRLSAGVAAVRLAVLVPALFLAARWGIVGVAAAQATLALAYAVLMHGFADRLLHLPARSVVRTLTPAVSAGVGIAVAATAARALSLPLLGSAVAAGGLLGLLFVAIVDRSFAREARSLTRVFA